MDRFNTYLQNIVLDIVQTQIDEEMPYETKATYKRLIKEGFTEIESKKMIGCILMNEIGETTKKRKSFDLHRYRKILSKLPKYPYVDIIRKPQSNKSL